MVWTDSVYANSESPPINEKEKGKNNKYNNWLAIQTLAVAPIEITTELVFNQPPTSRHYLIPDSEQAACSQLTNSVQQRLL